MHQEEEDPALLARKKELHALLDSSLDRGVERADVEHPNSKGTPINCIGIEEEITLPNDPEDKHKDFQPVELESRIENYSNDTMNSSQSVNTNEVSDVVNTSFENDNFCTPLLALNFCEEFRCPPGNFTKGCKWSPDGSCLLVGSDDRRLRLINLPSQVACGDIQDENWYFSESQKHLKPAVTVKEASCIYDYTWYPKMHSSSLESCCFAVTCRGCPVHLWDAWHGNLICSYKSYDHFDELVAAHSVNFNLDGSKIVCGYNRCIRIFNTSRPGRQFEKVDAKEQPGIISCFAFNPSLPSVFVTGSYLGNLGLYTTESNRLFCRIDGCQGGITQLQFSSDGIMLYSGARMSNELMCWDIRNPGKILWTFQREVKTNQRIAFDLEPRSNKYLASGSTDGKVLKWDLHSLVESENKNPPNIKPTSTFTAHNDCCNGVSINPHFPVLATSSGQRHNPEPVSLSDIESGNEEDDAPLFVHSDKKQENSVKLWWIGKL